MYIDFSHPPGNLGFPWFCCVLTATDFRRGLETYATQCFPHFTHFVIKCQDTTWPRVEDADNRPLQERFSVVCGCCQKDLRPGGTIKTSVHPTATLANFN
jgi:hypothetical protein